MTAEQLERLNENLQAYEHPIDVGLYNVQTRVKLYFRDEYGIQVESVEGKATIITLFLSQDGICAPDSRNV